MILERVSGSSSTACKIKPIISGPLLVFKLYNTTLVRYVAIIKALTRTTGLLGMMSYYCDGVTEKKTVVSTVSSVEALE